LERALSRIEEPTASGPRLVDDARRLWNRVNAFITQRVVLAEIDPIAVELACYALQLPLRSAPRGSTGGKPPRATVRDRAEQAAEMLITALDKLVDAATLAHTVQILQQLSKRPPALDEARLVSDALNLDDFGVIGLLQQAIQISRQGSGLAQVAEGCEKRDQYGYWEARLKDSFHFEAVRKIAAARVEHTRKTAALLLVELSEDQSAP
jgi:hypothetical protein